LTIRDRSTQRIPLGGFGSGPVARDLWILLGVLFVTFSLQFFQSTALVPALLRLTPYAWQRLWIWQLATYPFIGAGGPSLWILLELYFLFVFARDVYSGLGRRHFWRLVVSVSVLSAAVALAVNALTALAGGGLGPEAFSLMQGQRILLSIMVAAFATANGRATILLMFVLPIEARWFLGIEILFAFIGFLQTRDLAGFLGVCSAVGLTYLYIRSGGGRRKRKLPPLREMRLRIERWWIARKLDRMKKQRGFRVIPGERTGEKDVKRGDVKKGPWVH
jgi:hypothetical protein